ncbi:MAG: hypothetical protein NT085_03120 [candidate division SR1 bacterium]|nr:hypothetical protein [candidate division SR1 bacterium]
MEKKKLLYIGNVLEPEGTYTNCGHYGDTEFKFTSARDLNEALSEIIKTKEPIIGIVFSRSTLVENYSKDRGNAASMLVIETAKKQYEKIKVVSMVFNDLDKKGKSAAIVGSYIAEKSDWRKIDDFFS